MPKARPGATHLYILILAMCHSKPGVLVYSTCDRSGPGLLYSVYYKLLICLQSIATVPDAGVRHGIILCRW